MDRTTFERRLPTILAEAIAPLEIDGIVNPVQVPEVEDFRSNLNSRLLRLRINRGTVQRSLDELFSPESTYSSGFPKNVQKEIRAALERALIDPETETLIQIEDITSKIGEFLEQEFQQIETKIAKLTESTETFTVGSYLKNILEIFATHHIANTIPTHLPTQEPDPTTLKMDPLKNTANRQQIYDAIERTLYSIGQECKSCYPSIPQETINNFTFRLIKLLKNIFPVKTTSTIPRKTVS